MSLIRTSTVLLLALGCAEVVVPVPADVPLGAIRDEHTQPFTGPIRLSELRDGRVLAIDVREQRLMLVDFAIHAERPVGSRGDGPLEYRSGHRFARAVGDSVWMFDIVRGRILVFSPAGAPVRSFDMTFGGGSLGRVSSPSLVAIDSAGDWYGGARAFSILAGGSAIAESTAVVRVAGADARQDTLAMLLSEGAARKTEAGLPRLSNFDPYDAFGVLSDGRVVVVRGATYSVEVVDRVGTSRIAGPIAHQRVALSTADIRMVADSTNRMMRGLLAMSFSQLPRRPGAPSPVPEYVLPEPVPAYWPALMDPVLPVDRQDRAWVAVRDSSLATKGQRYDLLDREGRWVNAVRIPRGSVLVGFGESTLYVARRDGDDLLWLGRYPLPE